MIPISYPMEWSVKILMPVASLAEGTSLAPPRENKSSRWANESPLNGAEHDGVVCRYPIAETQGERRRVFAWGGAGHQSGGEMHGDHGTIA